MSVVHNSYLFLVHLCRVGTHTERTLILFFILFSPVFNISWFPFYLRKIHKTQESQKLDFMLWKLKVG